MAEVPGATTYSVVTKSGSTVSLTPTQFKRLGGQATSGMTVGQITEATRDKSPKREPSKPSRVSLKTKEGIIRLTKDQLKDYAAAGSPATANLTIDEVNRALQIGVQTEATRKQEKAQTLQYREVGPDKELLSRDQYASLTPTQQGFLESVGIERYNIGQSMDTYSAEGASENIIVVNQRAGIRDIERRGALLPDGDIDPYKYLQEGGRSSTLVNLGMSRAEVDKIQRQVDIRGSTRSWFDKTPLGQLSQTEFIKDRSYLSKPMEWYLGTGADYISGERIELAERGKGGYARGLAPGVSSYRTFTEPGMKALPWWQKAGIVGLDVFGSALLVVPGIGAIGGSAIKVGARTGVTGLSAGTRASVARASLRNIFFPRSIDVPVARVPSAGALRQTFIDPFRPSHIRAGFGVLGGTRPVGASASRIVGMRTLGAAETRQAAAGFEGQLVKAHAVKITKPPVDDLGGDVIYFGGGVARPGMEGIPGRGATGTTVMKPKPEGELLRSGSMDDFGFGSGPFRDIPSSGPVSPRGGLDLRVKHETFLQDRPMVDFFKPRGQGGSTYAARQQYDKSLQGAGFGGPIGTTFAAGLGAGTLLRTGTRLGTGTDLQRGRIEDLNLFSNFGRRIAPVEPLRGAPSGPPLIGTIFGTDIETIGPRSIGDTPSIRRGTGIRTTPRIGTITLPKPGPIGLPDLFTPKPFPQPQPVTTTTKLTPTFRITPPFTPTGFRTTIPITPIIPRLRIPMWMPGGGIGGGIGSRGDRERTLLGKWQTRLDLVLGSKLVQKLGGELDVRYGSVPGSPSPAVGADTNPEQMVVQALQEGIRDIDHIAIKTGLPVIQIKTILARLGANQVASQTSPFKGLTLV